MKMMKRSLALLLCFLMLSSGPISAFATEGVSDNDNDDPVVCTVCGVENCETTHVYCDTCEKYDCGLTHTTCDKCGTVDCQSTHEAWCDTCKKDSCGVDHTTPPADNGSSINGEAEGCTECGETEGHLDSCSQYINPIGETAEVPIPCSLCGQSGTHSIGCFATFTEVNQVGYFVSDSVTLYRNPTQQPDDTITLTAEQLPESFTVQYSFPGDAGVTWYVLDTENWGIFADTDAPYSYIQSDYVTFDLDTEDKTEQTLTDEGSGVRVSGYLPEGTSLSVESANLDDVAKVDPTFAHIQGNFKIYDISLMKDGTIHQPGETVSVTMDVRDVASIGEKVFVYHVHGNEDGTTETEILGPYTIDSEGEINFDMDKFSYVIVVNNDVHVENIQAFYTVTGTSGNKHFHASCIYITNTGDVHMILTGNQSQAAGCYATNVSVNDVSVTSLKETTNHGQVTSYVIRNAENQNDVTEIVTSGSKYNYVIDINLGTEVSLNGQFNVSVTWNDGTINGFKIEGMEVTIVFNEGIQKTVYSVNDSVIDYTNVPLDYVPEVNAGDVIIYKIEVKNGEDSTQDLTCNISDILPEGLFNNNTIQISQNLSEGWSSASVVEYGKVNIASNVLFIICLRL